MGNCLAAWIETLPPEHPHRSCLERIVDMYGSLDNFENVLADLITCPPRSRAAALGGSRPHLLCSLTNAIRDHFAAIRSGPTPLYDRLAGILRPGDVVVSFNYDLGVERSLRTAGLWKIEKGYGFPIGALGTSPVEVLKLHGSTNWDALLFGGRTSGFFTGNIDSLGDRPVLFFRPDLKYLGYRGFVDPLCRGLDRAPVVPAMILPALPKQFYFATTFGKEWKPFWDDLWEHAKDAIENASELIVIGYSFPTADKRARSMLLETANKSVRLSICCGAATADIEQQFRDNKFSNIVAIATTFEDFLARYTEARRPISRLNALVGKHGMLLVWPAREPAPFEVAFTFVTVYPARDTLPGDDDQAIQTAITRSSFLVRFDEGVLIEGSDHRVISGHDPFRIVERY